MKIRVSFQNGEVVCEIAVQPNYSVIHRLSVAEAKILKAQLEAAIKTSESNKP